MLNPQKQGDGLTSHHLLAAIWDGDGQIHSADEFEQYLKQHATLLANPPKVEVGNPEHAK